MWRLVGIRRDTEGLDSAASQVGFWERYVSTREFHSPTGWELQNMLLVARLMITAATSRTESRGSTSAVIIPKPIPIPPVIWNSSVQMIVPRSMKADCAKKILSEVVYFDFRSKLNSKSDSLSIFAVIHSLYTKDIFPGRGGFEFP